MGDIKNRKSTPSAEKRAEVEQDLDYGQLTYDLALSFPSEVPDPFIDLVPVA